MARASKLVAQTHSHDRCRALESSGHGRKPLDPNPWIEVRVSEESIPIVEATAPLGSTDLVIEYHHQSSLSQPSNHSLEGVHERKIKKLSIQTVISISMSTVWNLETVATVNWNIIQRPYKSQSFI